LTDVTFDKGWVQGTLDGVTVDRKTRAIRIHGGDISVYLDKRPSGGSGGVAERGTIWAEGLQVQAFKDKHFAVMSGVGWDGKKVTWKTSIITVEGYWSRPVLFMFMADNGAYEPKVALQVGHLKGRAPVVEKIPGISLEGVEFDVRDFEFDEASSTAKVSKMTVSKETPETELIAAESAIFILNPQEQKLGFFVPDVRIHHPWVSLKPERFKNVLGSIEFKPLALVLWAPLKAKFQLEEREVLVQGSCQEWANVVGGDTVLKDIPFQGQLHLEAGLKPAPHLRMDQKGMPATCQPTSCEVFAKLRKPFQYTAIHANGEPFERTSGPGTPEWVYLGGMGKMPMAVETLEDPGFKFHRGFIRQAYENSLIDNVSKGKFNRGGSTLTMQLVKNLYLRREKTLLRKVQELLLAMAMEKCLSKAEIIELYLNVVEFGRDVYGVGPGAKHWFHRFPEALSPVEAFWMASILPKPRLVAPPDEASLKGIERLMSSLAKQGKIPEWTGSVEDVDTSGWESAP
jgi:hypothetical protein